MKTTSTSLILKNFIIGFIVHYFCFILLLFIVLSIFYGQFDALFLLYIFASSPVWVIPFSIYFFLIFPIALLKTQLSINIQVFISALVVAILIFVVFNKINGIGSDKALSDRYISHDENSALSLHIVLKPSFSIIHGITTYISYLVRRKNWKSMFS